MSIKDFRLTEETAFLFVLSYEYGLSFVTLLKLYELSDTLFWGYIAALTPALKMGVRKGSQLSKTSQRLYKSFLGLKERKQEKVEKLVETEDGEIVLDKKGNPKKEKITVNRYEPIILTDEEKITVQGGHDYFNLLIISNHQPLLFHLFMIYLHRFPSQPKNKEP